MVRTVEVDAAGRIEIPEELLARLGWEAGTRLRMVEEGDRLVLEPAVRVEEAPLMEKDGLPVIRGRLTGEVPDHRDLRERRIERLADGLEQGGAKWGD